MNSLTVFLYLFGHAGAIRRIASSRAAVPTGILFVLSAGVARNYDQMWYGESLWWLFGPLLFSLFSGLWLFLFIAPLHTSRKAAGESIPPAEIWRTSFWKVFPARRHLAPFFGLFWMTAPIAWVYAIPVERWFDPVTAARWNVGFLAIVSLWRVLLMSRVVAVIGEMPFIRALGRVLLPASLEVLGVGYFTRLGAALIAGMAGLRNSPAEEVLLHALSISMTLAFFASFAALLIRFLYRNIPRRNAIPDPKILPAITGFPYTLLILVAAFCWWLSIAPQREQRLTHQAKQFAKNRDWPGLVAFLSAHPKEEFAPSVPLPPTAWEMWGVRDLPFVLEQFTMQTPVWVRELYIGYVDSILDQPRARYRLQPSLANALEAARDVPEIKALKARHAEALHELQGTGGTERPRFQPAENNSQSP